MSRETYEAKTSGERRKGHLCIRCGCIFYYTLRRETIASADSPEAALKAARRQLVKELTEGVDMHPCPACGIYQPEMVAEQQRNRHGLSLVMLGVVLAGGFSCGFCCTGTHPFISWVCGGAAFLSVLIHIYTLIMNPNRNLPRNKEIARAEVAEGVVELLQPGDAMQSLVAMTPHSVHALEVVLVIVTLMGAIAVFAAEGLRLLQGHSRADILGANPSATGQYVTVWFLGTLLGGTIMLCAQGILTFVVGHRKRSVDPEHQARQDAYDPADPANWDR